MYETVRLSNTRHLLYLKSWFKISPLKAFLVNPYLYISYNYSTQYVIFVKLPLIFSSNLWRTLNDGIYWNLYQKDFSYYFLERMLGVAFLDPPLQCEDSMFLKICACFTILHSDQWKSSAFNWVSKASGIVCS